MHGHISEENVVTTSKRRLLLATRAASHQRARMAADKSGGAGNQQAQDNGKRQKFHHRPNRITLDTGFKSSGGRRRKWERLWAAIRRSCRLTLATTRGVARNRPRAPPLMFSSCSDIARGWDVWAARHRRSTSPRCGEVNRVRGGSHHALGKRSP